MQIVPRYIIALHKIIDARLYDKFLEENGYNITRDLQYISPADIIVLFCVFLQYRYWSESDV